MIKPRAGEPGGVSPVAFALVSSRHTPCAVTYVLLTAHGMCLLLAT